MELNFPARSNKTPAKDPLTAFVHLWHGLILYYFIPETSNPIAFALTFAFFRRVWLSKARSSSGVYAAPTEVNSPERMAVGRTLSHKKPRKSAFMSRRKSDMK